VTSRARRCSPRRQAVTLLADIYRPTEARILAGTSTCFVTVHGPLEGSASADIEKSTHNTIAREAIPSFLCACPTMSPPHKPMFTPHLSSTHRTARSWRSETCAASTPRKVHSMHAMRRMTATISVEWTAGLPGSSGKVGMYGFSYVGATQWLAAVMQPPHLAAIARTGKWARLLRQQPIQRSGLFPGGSCSWLCLMREASTIKPAP
jgi:X-Pro dipeptidyl-peptidase (S15 family)